MVKKRNTTSPSSTPVSLERDVEVAVWNQSYSTELSVGVLLHKKKQEDLTTDDSSGDEYEESSSLHSEQSLKPSSTNLKLKNDKVFQLIVGSIGIYVCYLYYGNVQEDLFRYRSRNGLAFTFVWFLQALESFVTMWIGYVGRTRNNKLLPFMPFFKSGFCQLSAKVLMNWSLAAGLSFPVVVLAKSAKIVPVMLGQLLLGGSSYELRDYLFAILIVTGTALVSFGKSYDDDEHEGSDTIAGVVLIASSLAADGFTGGLQKKLKRETASMKPNTYDFLLYSHIVQWAVAVVVCLMTGEVWTAPRFILHNPQILYLVIASCICSALGQCFIFYVISNFDPLVCTTITTTRKMISVILSISFKGHVLNHSGFVGLALAGSALVLEVEGKYRESQMSNNNNNSPPVKAIR